MVVVGDDDRVKLQRVRIARDYGSDVEIEGGLPPGARIALSPPESISDGDKVRVAGADGKAESNVAQTSAEKSK